MGYLTDATGRKLYVLRKISTGEILKRNILYPNIKDDAPVLGLDKDLEFLPIFEIPQGNFDSRYFTTVRSEQKNGANWEVSFNLQKRSADEIKQFADMVERAQSSQHLQADQRDKITFLALYLLFRGSPKLTLSANEQALVDNIMANGLTLWKNNDNLEALKAEIDIGLEPSLDGGWEAASLPK